MNPGAISERTSELLVRFNLTTAGAELAPRLEQAGQQEALRLVLEVQLRALGLNGLLHPLGVPPLVAIEHRAKRLFHHHLTAAGRQMQDPHIFGIGALAQAAAQSVIGAAKHQARE